MARVAIVMSNFWPEPTGGAPTCTEFSIFLRQAGHEVSVVTAMPFYPQWDIWPAFRGRLWRRDEHEGLKIHRAWHFVRPRVSTLTRMLHELTLGIMSLPAMLRVIAAADVVYLFTPALSYAYLGSLVARLFGKRRVVVVKDVMPDAAIELGMLKNPAMIAASRGMARSLYRHAAEIHTLGAGMRDRIAAECEEPAKIRLVSDTIDADELSPVAYEENEFRRKFVKPGTFAVLHTGNMGKKQDLPLILRTAALLRDDPTIHFYVFGGGAVKDEFLAERARLGLDNVSHFDLQERWMLRHMLSGADVVLVSQLKEVVDIVVPSKLLTSLISGAMVVATAAEGSAPDQILRESDGGLCLPAEDEHALADTLRRIRDGGVDTAHYRRNARAFAMRRFDRRTVYGPIARELTERFGTTTVPPVAAPPAGALAVTVDASTRPLKEELT